MAKGVRDRARKILDMGWPKRPYRGRLKEPARIPKRVNGWGGRPAATYAVQSAARGQAVPWLEYYHKSVLRRLVSAQYARAFAHIVPCPQRLQVSVVKAFPLLLGICQIKRRTRQDVINLPSLESSTSFATVVFPCHAERKLPLKVVPESLYATPDQGQRIGRLRSSRKSAAHTAAERIFYPTSKCRQAFCVYSSLRGPACRRRVTSRVGELALFFPLVVSPFLRCFGTFRIVRLPTPDLFSALLPVGFLIGSTKS